MENDVLDSLQDVLYSGPLEDESILKAALNDGLKNKNFRELISWICGKLSLLLHLDECISAAPENENIAGFAMELSSLLKELGCPFAYLTEGPVSERLSKKEDRVVLLEYLLSELMAARIVKTDKPANGLELRVAESSTANDLKKLLLALQFPKPPDNISSKDLFSKINMRLKEVIAKSPKELIGQPLLTGRLSDEQWEILRQVQVELQQEYRLRREMLLRRLDVTIQSFQWSDRAKGKEDAFTQHYVSKRKELVAEPNVDLADVIAAREDLAIIEKTSSSNVRKNTQSSINKVIIGRVPDRGGRPSEQAAPPPEMPSWQKERAQGGGGGGGNRGGGFARGGGGRVQGNWNPKGDRNYDSQRQDRSDDRGSRQDNRGEGRGYRQDGRGEERGGYRGGRGGRGRDRW